MQLYLIFPCAIIALGIYGMIKATYDFIISTKILRAIYNYCVNTNASLEESSNMFDSVEPFNNWINWEYDSLVPREVYDKIKPYL